MKTILPFNLMSDKQADEIITWFKVNITLDDIKERAEQFYKDAHGGILKEKNIIPRLIHQTVVQYAMNIPHNDLGLGLVKKVEEALIKHYGDHPGWLPPRVLAREAIALTVQRDQVIDRLARLLDSDQISVTEQVNQRAGACRDPETAFTIPDIVIDETINRIGMRLIT